ncbi:MAG: riboflavin biosynthesis protein RibF [Planctomyces sp.]|nr:riboflavin biosynthesis protein RibF [Planctomyces sp.]
MNELRTPIESIRRIRISGKSAWNDKGLRDGTGFMVNPGMGNPPHPAGCKPGGCIAIGNFDGVHLGHRSMLRGLRDLADSLGTHTVAVTFHPHPIAVLRPEQAPPLLTSIPERKRLLLSAGADFVEVLQVTEELLRMSATEFFEDYILGRYQASGVVEGVNFRFGYDRQGDVGLLEALSARHNLAFRTVQLLAGSVEAVRDPVGVSHNAEVSSSRIRALISEREIAAAVALLGHPYTIRGVVGSGARRGRQLGFPTANLERIETLVPGDGVYAGETVLDGVRKTVAINIGPNPTFGETSRKVECHVLDFAGDLYGKQLSVDVLSEVRGLRKFSSRSELMDQIQIDLQTCKRIALAADTGSSRG